MTVTPLRTEQSLPHSIEAEQMVLGAILANNDRYNAVRLVLDGGMFYDPLHGRIWDHITDLIEAGDLASPVTLKARMVDDEGLRQIGAGYLAKLVAVSPDSRSLRDYAGLVSDAAAKRRIVAAIRNASEQMNSQTAGQIAADLETSLAEVAAATDRAGPMSMLAAVTEAMKDVKQAMESGELPGVRPAVGTLTDLVPMFGPGELILLGGRPSMGKTGVALSIATAAARAGHGVIIVSLEMLPKALALRAVSEASALGKQAVAFSKMAMGDVPDIHRDPMLEAAREVARLPIQFLSREYATIGAMTAGVREARKLLPKDKTPLVVVDYAQLLNSPAKTRYEQITEISIALKGMAMRLECPVLALSQLSRSLESREDKRPQLSDLRESGQLEQDADTVLFCYRDEYYIERQKPDEDDLDAMQAWEDALKRAHNRLEIIVGKQRQGPVGVAHMRFNPALNLIWSDR